MIVGNAQASKHATLTYPSTIIHVQIKDPGDRHNRDMLIDSSLLGVDGTAELIEDVAKKIMNK